MKILDIAFYQAKNSEQLSPELRAKVKNGNLKTHIWDDHIWPCIKQKIGSTLECIAMKLVNPRNRSYELLGYDVILDQFFNPFILEVNMSPAMAHRSQDQSLLIQNMSRKMVSLAIFPHLDDLSKENYIAWLSNCHLSSRENFGGRGKGGKNNNNSVKFSECHDGGSQSDEDHSDSEIQEEVKRNRDWQLLFCDSRIDNATVYHKCEGNTTFATSDCDEVDGCAKLDEYIDEQIPQSSLMRRTEISVGSTHSNAVTLTAAMSLFIVGKQISNGSMDYIDFLCKQMDEVVKLQKWFRVYVRRVRHYHLVRKLYATTIQCKIRQFIAKRRRRHLYLDRCCQWIEEVQSIKLKYHVVNHWYMKYKASIIWFYYSKYKLKKLKRHQFLQGQARKIQKCYRMWKYKYVFQAYGKLRKIVNFYKRWRNRCIHLVVVVLKLLIRRRVMAKRRITRYISYQIAF